MSNLTTEERDAVEAALTDEERAVLEKATEIAAPIFLQRDWQWALTGVPNHNDIYEHLLWQLRDIKNDPDPEFALHSCGRLMLTRHVKDEVIEVHLDLGAIFGLNNEQYAEMLREEEG